MYVIRVNDPRKIHVKFDLGVPLGGACILLLTSLPTVLSLDYHTFAMPVAPSFLE